jgi:hypothetical protein
MDMSDESISQHIGNLTLMLLYLTSWEEKDLPHWRKSWKGYDFDVRDQLEGMGLISGNHRAKSLYLSKAGIEAAVKLLKEYGID